MVKKLRLLIAITAVFILVLSGCSSAPKTTKKVEDFTFTDQNGKKFGLKDLKGKIWVSDFVFTSCTTICPPMTHNMSELQKKVEEEGLDNVEFVSFSVDPAVDSPEALKEYAGKYDGDLSKWHFLTGYSQDKIEQFAKDNFSAFVKKPDSGDQVIHGISFYIINKKGEILEKNYAGNKDVPYDEIIDTIKKLN
ncbi:SCO family protein [Falsibacillus pallidus]|uniref:Protein SCO1/2 n=1 Tax=Falsibacillus pallidus TaxID=493781 RepID=A0A370GX82_9BACI|nr:SCO family protein [Falsibacillus pallidus]RDI47850.1 protein SCO1/2 [Falsibacillus pallidus]